MPMLNDANASRAIDNETTFDTSKPGLTDFQ